VNFGLVAGPPLGALEEWQDVVPTPAAIAKLRPVVVILRLAADVDQPVDRRRAAEHAAARILLFPMVEQGSPRLFGYS
jgi:hypothetical protein